MTKTLTSLLAAAALTTAPVLAQGHEATQHGAAQHAHDHTSEAAPLADAPIDPVATRTLTVRVDGMVCDFCARSLTKVLGRKDSVEDVAVSLEDKTVTILLAEGASMTDAEVEEAVLSAGYNLASIERS